MATINELLDIKRTGDVAGNTGQIFDEFQQIRQRLGLPRPENTEVAKQINTNLTEPEKSPGFQLGQNLLTERAEVRKRNLNDILQKAGLGGTVSGPGLEKLVSGERQTDIDLGNLALDTSEKARGEAQTQTRINESVFESERSQARFGTERELTRESEEKRAETLADSQFFQSLGSLGANALPGLIDALFGSGTSSGDDGGIINKLLDSLFGEEEEEAEDAAGIVGQAGTAAGTGIATQAGSAAAKAGIAAFTGGGAAGTFPGLASEGVFGATGDTLAALGFDLGLDVPIGGLGGQTVQAVAQGAVAAAEAAGGVTSIPGTAAAAQAIANVTGFSVAQIAAVLNPAVAILGPAGIFAAIAQLIGDKDNRSTQFQVGAAKQLQPHFDKAFGGGEGSAVSPDNQSLPSEAGRTQGETTSGGIPLTDPSFQALRPLESLAAAAGARFTGLPEGQGDADRFARIIIGNLFAKGATPEQAVGVFRSLGLSDAQIAGPIAEFARLKAAAGPITIPNIEGFNPISGTRGVTIPEGISPNTFFEEAGGANFAQIKATSGQAGINELLETGDIAGLSDRARRDTFGDPRDDINENIFGELDNE